MKRSWQALLVVVVLGLAAGAAIAGRQALPDNDIRITGATAPEGSDDSSSTSAPAPTAAEPTTAEPTTAEPTTAAPATGVASESSVLDASAIEATTTEATTTEATATEPATTTTRPPTTTRAPATTEQTEQTDPATATTAPAQTPTTVIPAEPDRAVRLVVANATNRAGLAAQTADWLTAVGYSQVLATDARNSRPETVLFTRPGFESAALQVAADLGLGQERVQPLPDTAISYNDAAGDVIVALGRDAPG